jgi:hypothetical protein
MEPHPGGCISTVTTRGIRRRRWKVEFFLSALIFCFNPVEMEIVVGQLMPWMGVADGSYHATVRDRNLFARRHLLFLCQTQQFGHKLNQTRCTVVYRTRRDKAGRQLLLRLFISGGHDSVEYTASPSSFLPHCRVLLVPSFPQ